MEGRAWYRRHGPLQSCAGHCQALCTPCLSRWSILQWVEGWAPLSTLPVGSWLPDQLPLQPPYPEGMKGTAGALGPPSGPVTPQLLPHRELSFGSVGGECRDTGHTLILQMRKLSLIWVFSLIRNERIRFESPGLSFFFLIEKLGNRARIEMQTERMDLWPWGGRGRRDELTGKPQHIYTTVCRTDS